MAKKCTGFTGPIDMFVFKQWVLKFKETRTFGEKYYFLLMSGNVSDMGRTGEIVREMASKRYVNCTRFHKNFDRSDGVLNYKHRKWLTKGRVESQVRKSHFGCYVVGITIFHTKICTHHRIRWPHCTHEML